MHQMCSCWNRRSVVLTAFVSDSLQNSMSRRRGALTICTQELQPSGRLSQLCISITPDRHMHAKTSPSTTVNLCVTVKEPKGFEPSTGVSFQDQNMWQWPCAGPGQSGCSAGSPAATRCCAAASTSTATTWREMKTFCTCSVRPPLCTPTARMQFVEYSLDSLSILQCVCLCVCVGLDPDHFESEEKSDKSKNPNSIQGGKWQLGFQGDFL